jgi:hypothetical protein
MTCIFKTSLPRAAALACGVALMLAGCDSDDDSSKPRGRSNARGDAASGDTAVVYALMIRDPDGISDYLMAGDDVPTGTIDTANGIYRLSEDASVEKVVESTRGDMRMMTRLQIAD